ncbi:hypothetical protein Tcan_01511, partial [Toxocara canis]
WLCLRGEESGGPVRSPPVLCVFAVINGATGGQPAVPRESQTWGEKKFRLQYRAQADEPTIRHIYVGAAPFEVDIAPASCCNKSSHGMQELIAKMFVLIISILSEVVEGTEQFGNNNNLKEKLYLQ